MAREMTTGKPKAQARPLKRTKTGVVDSISGAMTVRVLVNEHVVLRRSEQSIYLAGVDDASYTRKDDPGKAMAGIPQGAAVILLSHAPDVILKPESARADLILAGHTHGGQIALTGRNLNVARFSTRYVAGPYRREEAFLYVSRGVGVGAVPVRVGAPPEIDLLTLRSTAASKSVAA